MRPRLRAKGPSAFGQDAPLYDRIRPSYAPAVLEILHSPVGARSGARAYDIGAGTGQMTRALLGLGVKHVTAIEPDSRLASFLAARHAGDMRVEVRAQRFEDAAHDGATLDLAVAATSFHWLEARSALARIRKLLKPGGWWLACWHVFNDPWEDDPFREATAPLFRSVGRVQQDDLKGPLAFGLDRESRERELREAGFLDISHALVRQKISLEANDVLHLYATFSPIATLTEAARARFLAGLRTVVDDRFGGRVERPLLTPVYWARNPQDGG